VRSCAHNLRALPGAPNYRRRTVSLTSLTPLPAESCCRGEPTTPGGGIAFLSLWSARKPVTQNRDRVVIPSALNRCHLGAELQSASREWVPGGWIIVGSYGCCAAVLRERVPVDVRTIVVAGRELEVKVQ
jgi:hypothetical protein